MNAYEDVRPGDPFERWHQVTCRNYSVTECRQLRDKSFSAQVAVRPFGELAISRISSRVGCGESLRVTRGRRDIRRDYRDDFFIWVGREGTTVLEQGGRSVQLKAGDLSLHDQASPFALSFSQVASSTMVIVPRRLMLERFPRAESCTALPVRAPSAIARLAVATVSQVATSGEATHQSDAHPDHSDEQAWSAALDIWVSAIKTCTGVASFQAAQQGNDRLRIAQRYLLKRLHDPELDLASAAADLNFSTRTLMRLFATQGSTPMNWLWQQRLQACFEALSRGDFPRVSDAAFAHGFSNLSHFSRAFKALHGINPQQLVREKG